MSTPLRHRISTRAGIYLSGLRFYGALRRVLDNRGWTLSSCPPPSVDRLADALRCAAPHLRTAANNAGPVFARALKGQGRLWKWAGVASLACRAPVPLALLGAGQLALAVVLLVVVDPLVPLVGRGPLLLACLAGVVVAVGLAAAPPAPARLVDRWWSESRLVLALTHAGVLPTPRKDESMPTLSRCGQPEHDATGTAVTLALPLGRTAADCNRRQGPPVRLARDRPGPAAGVARHRQAGKRRPAARAGAVAARPGGRMSVLKLSRAEVESSASWSRRRLHVFARRPPHPCYEACPGCGRDPWAEDVTSCKPKDVRGRQPEPHSWPEAATAEEVTLYATTTRARAGRCRAAGTTGSARSRSARGLTSTRTTANSSCTAGASSERRPHPGRGTPGGARWSPRRDRHFFTDRSAK